MGGGKNTLAIGQNGSYIQTTKAVDVLQRFCRLGRKTTYSSGQLYTEVYYFDVVKYLILTHEYTAFVLCEEMHYIGIRHLSCPMHREELGSGHLPMSMLFWY